MASRKTTLKTLAQTMAEFTFALRYDSIPPEVKITARRHLADTLAREDNLGKPRAAEISP